MSNAQTETQTQATGKGDLSYVITRNGRHQYKFYKDYTDQYRGRTEESVWYPSVTTIANYIGGDNFSMGMNWALAQARDNGNDLDAPRRLSKLANEEGNRLHADIDQFIKDPRYMPSEDNDLFMLWHRELGGQRWLASEQFVVHPNEGYGGTVDAISLEPEGFTIWDWKTKNRSSYEKNGGLAKDPIQLTAYAQALHAMGHPLAPVKGFIAYIMRDGESIDVVPVDISPIGKSEKLFHVAHDMYDLMRTKKTETEK